MLVEILVLLAAVGGSAWIVGTITWLWFRVKRLEEERLVPGEGRRELLDRIGALADELESTRAETGRLNEKVTFFERLLQPDASHPRPAERFQAPAKHPVDEEESA